ncbi:RagB/SusD family nutrient uptake outer membrane protein [Sphingobacterium kyonggiense]
MKRIKLIYILLLNSIILMTACQKFLDVVPSTGNVNPSTIKDFQEMLNSDSLAICNFILADLMSDDVTIGNVVRNEHYGNSYTWAANIWGPGEMDFMYKGAYNRILQMNILLEKASKLTPTIQEEKDALAIVLAQAKINHAWYYLQLANIYGQDYTNGKADTELAVPIALVPDASVKPVRSTVKEVYDQVIKDLTEAANTEVLPVQGKTVIHPGKASAFAILARAYLFMGNYELALKNADAALNLKSTLTDYTKLKAIPMKLLDQNKNPEVLVGKAGLDQEFRLTYKLELELSESLDSLFSDDDYRRTLTFNYYNEYLSEGINFNFNYSVGVPEVYLIKAECLARAGNAQSAIFILNNLRKNRISNYNNLAVPNEADVLKLVLEERRRELSFHGGLRLFDQKRLNRDPRFRKKVIRKYFDYNEYEEVIVTSLEPNSPRYLMEIAPVIINNNDGIKPNPR